MCAGYIDDIHISGCQTGLPQGSACSPIIAAFLTGLIKIALPPSVRIIIFVDDILIMAKTDLKLDAAKHALFSAFGKSPAGTFKLTTSEQNLKSGIDFIGYNMKYNASSHLLVSATSTNEICYLAACLRHEKTLKNIYKKKPLFDKGRQAIAHYLLYRLSWVTSFQKANNFKALVYIALKKIMNICDIYDEFFTSVTNILKIDVNHKYKKNISHPDGYEMLPNLNCTDFVKLFAVANKLTDSSCAFSTNFSN